jgi:RsiW-degrading membrane proteinase PrsW (M82 family)
MVTDLEALGSLDRTAFMNVIKHNIDTLYKRKPMSDFKYLEYSFDPPWWVVVISLLVGILSAGGTTYYFYTQASHTTIQYRRRKL